MAEKIDINLNGKSGIEQGIAASSAVFGPLLGPLFVILVTVIPLTLLRAWVLQKVWNWYIMHDFSINLTMTGAFGISLFFGLLTAKATKSDGQPINWLLAFFLPLITLFVGWVGTFFL